MLILRLATFVQFVPLPEEYAVTVLPERVSRTQAAGGCAVPEAELDVLPAVLVPWCLSDKDTISLCLPGKLV